jgi:hypothetical protein
VKPLDKSDPANQLRALRLALGVNFRPLPGDELADLINIPPIAIRAVESRRRKLSEDDRQNIRILLGAIWDAKREQWVTVWDGTPYTREKFEERQKMLAYLRLKPATVIEPGSIEVMVIDLDEHRTEYHKTVDLFLDQLDITKRYLALTKLFRELRRIAAQDKIELGGLE